MALPDLTGQNIQDTYKRVLQVDENGIVYDGTGSLAPTLQVTSSFSISSSHEITYERSSSYAETSSFSNELTVGGNITASGNISASGTITTSGATIKGHLTGKNSGLNDSHLTAFTNIQGYGNFTMGNSETIDSHIITGRSKFVGNITASSNISASGNIQCNTLIGTINGGTF
mgnify:FL=1